MPNAELQDELVWVLHPLVVILDHCGFRADYGFDPD
jgi:hypothetical protein